LCFDNSIKGSFGQPKIGNVKAQISNTKLIKQISNLEVFFGFLVWLGTI